VSAADATALAASFLGRVPADAQAAMLAGYAILTVPAGTILPEPELAIVSTGLLRVFLSSDTDRQVTVAYRSPSSAVGLTQLVAPTFPTSFQAVVETRLISVSPHQVIQFADEHPELSRLLAREIALQVDGFLVELARLAFRSVSQRTAFHLLAMTATEPLRPTPVRITDLARATGTVREVAGRTVHRYEAMGCIKLSQGGVVAVDRLALGRLAEG
jgi:CRP-like cAMP-binding protein